jgi:hypothetical protein
LPEGFPTGKANIEVFISPEAQTWPAVHLPELVACLKDIPNFAGEITCDVSSN